MILRSDNRTADQIRRVNIVPDFISTAEGSAVIEMGNTQCQRKHTAARFRSQRDFTLDQQILRRLVFVPPFTADYCRLARDPAGTN